MELLQRLPLKSFIERERGNQEMAKWGNWGFSWGFKGGKEPKLEPNCLSIELRHYLGLNLAPI